MDALQDFYKEAKNRIVNPLFLSFTLSWLLWNWKVSIGFLMYNQETIKNYGYSDFKQLIELNASWEYYLCHPLCSALIYTIAFPPIRVLIIAFLAWMNRITTWSKKKILKNSTVPMGRFIKETDRTDALAKKLEELYTKDSDTIQENDKLKDELNTAQNKIVEYERSIQDAVRTKDQTTKEYEHLSNELKAANSKIEKYDAQNDHKIINGSWLLQVTPPLNAQIKSYNINIDDNKIYIVDDTLAWEWGEIISFNYNYFHKRVNMTMMVQKHMDRSSNDFNERRVLYHQKLMIGSHDINGHLNEMSGVDNEGNDVSYRYRG